MAHFAELDENNYVIRVLAINNEDCCDANGVEKEEIGILHLKTHHGQERVWVQTSYNGNFRCRYAGMGNKYDINLDAFIPPKPYPSWTLNTDIKDWVAPIPMPELTPEQAEARYYYDWNEDNLTWVLIEPVDISVQ